MEETELEEGEACFDDNDASIDPDTALSYIVRVFFLCWVYKILNFLHHQTN